MTTDARTGAPEVIITQTRSPTERAILRRWADEHHPGAAVVPIGDGPEAPAALGAALHGDSLDRAALHRD